jgi:hypothetical protein
MGSTEEIPICDVPVAVVTFMSLLPVSPDDIEEVDEIGNWVA